MAHPIQSFTNRHAHRGTIWTRSFSFWLKNNKTQHMHCNNTTSMSVLSGETHERPEQTMCILETHSIILSADAAAAARESCCLSCARRDRLATSTYSVRCLHTHSHQLAWACRRFWQTNRKSLNNLASNRLSHLLSRFMRAPLQKYASGKQNTHTHTHRSADVCRRGEHCALALNPRMERDDDQPVLVRCVPTQHTTNKTDACECMRMYL